MALTAPLNPPLVRIYAETQLFETYSTDKYWVFYYKWTRILLLSVVGDDMLCIKISFGPYVRVKKISCGRIDQSINHI